MDDDDIEQHLAPLALRLVNDQVAAIRKAALPLVLLRISSSLRSLFSHQVVAFVDAVMSISNRKERRADTVGQRRQVGNVDITRSTNHVCCYVLSFLAFIFAFILFFLFSYRFVLFPT